MTKAQAMKLILDMETTVRKGHQALDRLNALHSSWEIAREKLYASEQGEKFFREYNESKGRSSNYDWDDCMA